MADSTKNVTGIVLNDEGSLTSVTMAFSGSKYSVRSISKWETHDIWRPLLLPSTGVTFGISSHWLRTGTIPDGYIDCGDKGNFTACTPGDQINLQIEAFQSYIGNMVPDDLFLCTIPLAFVDNCTGSFLSLYSTAEFVKVAFIKDSILQLVFTFPAGNHSKIAKNLLRLEYYWKNRFDIPFPKTAFVFGRNLENFQCSSHTIDKVELPNKLSSQDFASLKAVGVALYKLWPSLPSYSNFSSKKSPVRALIRTGAVVMGGLAVLISTIFPLTNYISSVQLNKCESQYRMILQDDSVVKKSLARGQELAHKADRLHSLQSRPARWSSLMQKLGEIRPQGLYFDRMGTEPVINNDSKMKFAFTGWAQSETMVTDLIQKMQEYKNISDVSLSSLERDPGKNICRFRILCIYQVSIK